MWSRDISTVGWTIVALILVVSGASDIVTPEIYQRVRSPGAEPVLKGAPVVLLGVAQLAIGLWLLYRQWFRRQT